MSETDFKVGDVVQLKSGGPKMTVTETGGCKVACSWFLGNSHGTYVFPCAVLNEADEDEESRPGSVLRQLVAEYDSAKILLRQAGFGVTGQGLLETVQEALDRITQLRTQLGG